MISYYFFRHPLLLSIPLHQQCPPFTFLVSLVTPGCTFISEYLEHGAFNEREYMTFVFLHLGYLTQYIYFSSSIRLPSKFMIPFFSISEQHFKDYMCLILSILNDGHLGYFHFLALVVFILFCQMALGLACSCFSKNLRCIIKLFIYEHCLF